MRDDDLYLVDIIEAHEAIARMMCGVPEGDFVTNETLCAAVEMKLVIMGEALVSLSEDTQQALTNVPVQQVRGLRNRIVHGYFTVDERLIYGVAVDHAPQLAAEAERTLAVLFADTYRRLQERRDHATHG